MDSHQCRLVLRSGGDVHFFYYLSLSSPLPLPHPLIILSPSWPSPVPMRLSPVCLPLPTPFPDLSPSHSPPHLFLLPPRGPSSPHSRGVALHCMVVAGSSGRPHGAPERRRGAGRRRVEWQQGAAWCCAESSPSAIGRSATAVVCSEERGGAATRAA